MEPKSEFVEWYFDTKRGNCFRINYKPNDDDPFFNIVNVNSGLYLELFTGQPSLFRVSDGNGFNIELKQYDGYPAIFNSFLVDVGTFTNIVVSPIRSKAMPKPYSDCIDLSTYSSPLFSIMKQLNITYSRERCLDIKAQLLLIKDHGCYSTRF